MRASFYITGNKKPFEELATSLSDKGYGVRYFNIADLLKDRTVFKAIKQNAALVGASDLLFTDCKNGLRNELIAPINKNKGLKVYVYDTKNKKFSPSIDSYLPKVEPPTTKKSKKDEDIKFTT